MAKKRKSKTSQKLRFKKTMKKCKGKKGSTFRSCVRKGLKK